MRSIISSEAISVPMRLFAAALLFFISLSEIPASAAPLTSQFFNGYSSATRVMSGTDYNMNDSGWLINISDQNRNTFAYKLFTGLLMLGYQTEIRLDGNSWMNPHLLALNAFQNANGLSQSDYVTSACLAQMDQQLTSRESVLAPLAQTFPLYNHMWPLHPNDISQDTLAAIYSLPITVLPKYLQMSLYEDVQCIAGQCDGFIQYGDDPINLSWPGPVDLSQNYQFVGAYFDSRVNNSRLPSAAVHVDTVLHEYAHYLDNIFSWKKDPLSPHIGSIDTSEFYNILYDMPNGSNGCYPKKSSDPSDWITKYGFHPGYGGCTGQQDVVYEEWAEAFSMYVAAGKDFRAAALNSALIAQQYNWLKDNIFHGLEYDTDLPRDVESGCNDVYGYTSALPGYAHCNNNYIWDFTLPVDPNSVKTIPDAFVIAPITNVAPTTLVVSDAFIVKGVNQPTAISIVNGEYSVNGSGFVSGPGTVDYGDSITVRRNSADTFSTTVIATLTIGGVEGAFSITTRNILSPTISGSPGTSAGTGTFYTFTPTSTGATSFSIQNMPLWAAFDSSTGTLSGTPSVSGVYGNIVISAINVYGTTALPAFTITVVLSPPTIAGTPAVTDMIGTFYTFTPTAINATSFSIANKPSWANFNSTTGCLNGFPNAVTDFNNIIISAVNSNGTADLPAFSISVKIALPIITAYPETTAVVGGNYGFWVWTTNATSVAVTANLPPGITMDTSTSPASFSGTPTTPGVYSNIIISANNSSGTTQLPPFTITVKLPTPTITGKPATVVVAGTAYPTFIPSTTYGNNFSLSGTLPPGMSFDPSSGSLSGTPSIAGTYKDIVITVANTDASASLPPFTITVFPNTDLFLAGNNMQTPRTYHTATILQDGTVLVTGGINGYDALASAELYNPAIRAWSSAGSMSVERSGHTATLLPDGSVLITGGYDNNYDMLASYDLYTPATNSWTSGVMPNGHAYHTATLFQSGKVLVVGGMDMDSGLVASADIYDSASKSWSTATSMRLGRSNHTANLLANGMVLVAGVSGDNSAEVYNPDNDNWSDTGLMNNIHLSHAATSLPNGKVLVTGGYGEIDGASAELYDPSSNNWSAAGSMATTRQYHSSTLLPDGTVLITGGCDSNYNELNVAEIYDPLTGIWNPIAAMSTPRASHTATLLLDGPVLIAGGYDGTASLSSIDLYGQKTVPDPFVFIPITGVNLTTAVASNTVVITGINTPAAVSINAGEYAVSTDGGSTWGAWSSLAGSVNPNDSIKVRQISSSQAHTISTAILTVGGVTGAFNVTTADVPGAPVMVNAVAGNALAVVIFTPPSFNGGSAITSYTVISNPAGKSTTGTSSPLTVTGLTNGTAYTFTATATNTVGTSVPSGLTTKVTPAASTPPTVTITATSKPANPSNLTNGQFAFSGANALSFQCKLDNSAYSPCSSPYVYNTLNDGLHTFSVQSLNTDNPPKLSTAATYTWTVDTTVPLITNFTVPALVKGLSVAPTVFTATDVGGSGISGYMITESNFAPLATASGWSATRSSSYTTTTDGNKTLYAWVKNKAGTVSVAASQLVTFDAAAPVVTFSAPAYSTSLTISDIVFTATDAGGSGVSGYMITATSTAPLATAAGWLRNAPSNFTATAGTMTLYAWAKDAVGNVSKPGVAKILVDVTKPVVSAFSVTTPFSGTSVPIKTFTATDTGVSLIAGYMITEDPGVPSANATGWTVAKPTSYTPKNPGDQTLTLYAWVKDGAGNVSAAPTMSATATLDSTPPTVKFSVPAYSKSLTIPGISFAGTSDGTGSGIVGYMITTTGTAPLSTATTWKTTAPITFSVVSAGTYDLFAWAKDKAGNVSLRSPGQTVIVDTIKPIVTAIMPVSVGKYTPVPVRITATDDSSGVVKYLVTTTSTSPTVAAAWDVSSNTNFAAGFATAGIKTLYGWAMDNAGNISLGKMTTVVITQ